MPCIEKEPIYDMYCIRRRQYQRFLNILFWGCLSGAVGSVNVWCSARRGVVEVVGSDIDATNCATKTSPKKDVQEALILTTPDAVHVVYWFLFNAWYLFRSQVKA